MRFIAPSVLALLLAPGWAFAAAITVDETALRQRLLRLPLAPRPGTDVVFPLADGRARVFHVRDSGTLPRGLVKRFPGLRSFRGEDDEGRTLRLDLSPRGIRASVRSGNTEWLIRPGDTWKMEPEDFLALGNASTPVAETRGAAQTRQAPTEAVTPLKRRRSARQGGIVRYDFRLAVAASSRYVARNGGTVASALAEIVHLVNRANEVLETDLGVHLTLVDRNHRIVVANARGDLFETHEPGPAAVTLIDREIGSRHYDIGHAFSTFEGGDSHVGTSCSDARDADFFATHKAAAWSGHADPAGSSHAFGYFMHVLGRQLGAWPTADACRRATLDDSAVEPGGGSTIMGYATSGCGTEDHWLQPRPGLYFHARSIEQIQAWLGSRGGRCAGRRLTSAVAPWIDPVPLAETTVIPARTPFTLDAAVEAASPGDRLTYTWEQMDAGTGQRGPLVDDGKGPLFRSFAPSSTPQRTFPRLPVLLGDERASPGETLPTTSRDLHFRLTVRDNAGAKATLASADRRVRVVDTGRAFAMAAPAAGIVAVAGGALDIRWDVAGTTEKPISCHFLHVDLSVDAGSHWLETSLATDVPNNGSATVRLPTEVTSDVARLRLRCDWRPFFAVSPGPFVIRAP
ncbi:MAG: reprolysin-like metallopeptidase [Luteibacter sp.]|uniref:reprolysin-like metallopeptidase n=1 Tax=Luteibacter sp. TaxID=1886636 RepID=UPI002806BBEB|nr:zinc-dependent metalloprotease family protein [Luteibacter sp.]MDQ7994461.1 zinc-dependent metalloprotease family protein [Luteibacter sp.]MDQ8050604.1 zinc-dependent metalloprotease family protein [Luteibacter sp.]